MARNFFFLIYLALLSALSGWLMSRMSFVGRVGINLFHKDYRFLKVWYRGGGLVFGVLLLFFLLQWLAARYLARRSAAVVQLIGLALAIGGLWLTYDDFRGDFTHRLLRERFHLGAFLFWIGWASIALYMLATGRLQRRSELQVERRQELPERR